MLFVLGNVSTLVPECPDFYSKLVVGKMPRWMWVGNLRAQPRRVLLLGRLGLGWEYT